MYEEKKVDLYTEDANTSNTKGFIRNYDQWRINWTGHVSPLL